MIKKVLLASFLGAMIMFSGCSDTDGEDRLAVQQMLDAKDYDGVISALESDSEANATTVSENMQLASAYMGASGLSYSNLVGMIAASTTAAPSLRSTRGVGDDPFADFANKLQDNAQDNPNVLALLDKAIAIYAKIRAVVPDNNDTVELYLGMAQIAKATTTFTYLGDVVALVENGIDNELLASSCAIVHIYAHAGQSSVTDPTNDCAYSVIMADNNTSDPYKTVKVTLTNNGSGDYLRLITANEEDVVVSDGYIDAITGEDTNESNNGNNIPKPVQDETLTIKAALLTTLNEGFDVILDLAPDDVKGDITDFKNEIDVDRDGEISAQEMADYINDAIDANT